MSALDDPRIVVVGAGVSGCACALAVAQAGLPVLLLNSALDSVGTPAYGPALWTAPDSCRVPLTSPGAAAGSIVVSTAPGLAHAWLEHSRVPTDGSPVLVMDRRSVSLETKWRLEIEPLVQLRQAIVTSVTPRSDGIVLIESAFGEQWEADVVVLAVGLALGGRTSIGEHESPGGRYGEVAADTLLECLTTIGVELHEREIRVGARLGRRSDALDLETLGGAGRVVTLAPCDVGGLTLPLAGHRPADDPDTLPPSPYEEPFHGRPNVVLMGDAEADGPFGPRDLWLAPDGIATGEWYLDPETDDATVQAIVSADGWWTAEPAHSVRGHVTVGDGSPRQIIDGVWVVGQVAGAGSYLESLDGGWRLGRRLGGLRGPLTVPDTGCSS